MTKRGKKQQKKNGWGPYDLWPGNHAGGEEDSEWEEEDQLLRGDQFIREDTVAISYELFLGLQEHMVNGERPAND